MYVRVIWCTHIICFVIHLSELLRVRVPVLLHQIIVGVSLVRFCVYTLNVHKYVKDNLVYTLNYPWVFWVRFCVYIFLSYTHQIIHNLSKVHLGVCVIREYVHTQVTSKIIWCIYVSIWIFVYTYFPCRVYAKMHLDTLRINLVYTPNFLATFLSIFRCISAF